MADVVEHKCPNCAAPLTPPAPGQATVVCSYCGVALQVVAPTPTPAPPPAAAWTCPRCHTANPAGFRFCARCGALQPAAPAPAAGPAPSPWTCRECGKQNSPHHRFCLGCGADAR